MQLSCKDINPNTECSFEAHGNTETDVARKMVTHVKSNHAGDVKGMSDDEMLKMFEAKVHE